MNLQGNSFGPAVALVAFAASLAARLATEHHLRPIPALLTAVAAGLAFPFALRLRWHRLAVWAITVGGRSPRWVGYTPRLGPRAARERARREPPPGPPPTLRDLVRVLPVAQTHSAGAATLTLLSLEIYADGLLVHGRLGWDGDAAGDDPPPPSGPAWHADLVDLSATDDRATPYHAWSWGGGGGADEWRFDHAFAPAPDPLARELRLAVPRLLWTRFSPFPGGPPQAEHVEDGPWGFVVPLTDAPPPGTIPVGV